MADTSTDQTVIEGLDTGKRSLLHEWFAPAPCTRLTFCRTWVWPYAASVVLFFGIPLVVGLCTQPVRDLFVPPPGYTVCFFTDWNMLFMTLVSFPLLVVFLLSERVCIPGALAETMRSGALKAQLHDSRNVARFCSHAERVYARWNVWGQVIGLAVGVCLACWNHLNVCDIAAKAAELAPGAAPGRLTALNWVFVLWQMPFMWGVVAFYIARYFATIWLLFRVAADFGIEIDAFNLDNAAGLKPIGQIGLRNQYLLIVFGINTILLTVVVCKLTFAGLPYFIGAAVAGYVLLGPLVFVGPLLPFRRCMKAERARHQGIVAKCLSDGYKRALETMATGTLPESEWHRLSRLREFKKIVDRIPVWPLDAVTLRRFLTAYAVPVLAYFASEAVRFFVDLLQKHTG